MMRSTNENTPEISNEELLRFAEESGGRSLQEILDDLESSATKDKESSR